MIALVVFTDGRTDLLAQTLASARENLRGNITRKVLIMDGDPVELPALRSAVDASGGGWHVVPWGERRGFAGSIAGAWALISSSMLDLTPDQDWYVFHLEDDFTINRPIDLDALADVLAQQPNLHQLALRRQPVNHIEAEAGGIVEMWPHEYSEHCMSGDPGFPEDHFWLEHRLFFTTNPSLYRRELCARGWPEVERSEEAFSRALFADPDARVGFWGARDSGEAVHHIGNDRRQGTGY